MKNSWAQPSLSRDFALLSAAILFVLCIISAWVTFTTYDRHASNIASQLEKESLRIEMALNMELESANYMLTSLGKQIVLDPDRSLVHLAQILKSFDKKDHIYSILSWVNTQQQLAVSSNKGVVEKPVDISDRDYVKKALAEPWKMNIGRPIEGRVSGRWIIPVSMGVTDYTGKFIGTVMISLDIHVLTDHLDKLIRREGISFAILSKTLIPITQISEDKDFVNHNFPIEKLVNFNFSKNQYGLISGGGMFWNLGNYAYYRATQGSPYIILVTYDARYSDETVRTLLWSRLLQMLGMALFFVMFLWITRVRVIKPVLDMTSIAASVAQGKIGAVMPKGGPIEIESLAAQIRKISDYVAENKRIESELRGKIYQLRKAREQAETDRRSQLEFVAYVCQELRNPLNSIIGGAQVLKDQLHGPLENRKYRQYSHDMHTTANQLMARTQDMMTLAKAETGYFDLSEKPLDVAGVINRAVRFISDKMQAEKLGIKIQMQEPVPRLIADEFRLQQILMNMLLHAMGHALPEGTLLLEARTISESRDKNYFVFIINSSGQATYDNTSLLALAEKLTSSAPHWLDAQTREQPDISLELAKVLVAMHGGFVDIAAGSDNAVSISIFLPGNRIRFVESQER